MRSLASPLQCSDDACAPRNTVAVATCSLTILFFCFFFYCPVPYSTLLCLARLEHFSNTEQQHLRDPYQRSFDRKICSFDDLFCSPRCCVKSLGRRFNAEKQATSSGYAYENALKPNRGARLNPGFQYLRMRSMSFFFKSRDQRTLKAAIKEAHKGGHAKNRHFMMLCTSHKYTETHAYSHMHICPDCKWHKEITTLPPILW